MTPRSEYTVQEVGRLAGLNATQVRAYARAGRLGAQVGPGGAWRFRFQDLVLLRSLKRLEASRVPHRKIVRALGRLRQQVPDGRPLSEVKIAVVGDQIVALSDGAVWSPDSGQARFDFSAGSPPARLVRRSAAFEAAQPDDPDMGADEWFEVGEELEWLAPEEAREAFRRALELAPLHARAHVRLARLLRDVGELRAAEMHCRVAVEEEPTDPHAFSQLGLSLEAQGRSAHASDALRMAVRLGSRMAESYEALARISEATGAFDEAQRWREVHRRLRLPAEPPQEDDPA